MNPMLVVASLIFLDPRILHTNLVLAMCFILLLIAFLSDSVFGPAGSYVILLPILAYDIFRD